MNGTFLRSGSMFSLVTLVVFGFSGCERIMPGVVFGPDAAIEVHTATSTHQQAVYDLELDLSAALTRPVTVTIIDLPLARPEGYRWQQATVHVAIKPAESQGDATITNSVSKAEEQRISQHVEQYLSEQVIDDITVVVRALQ